MRLALALLVWLLALASTGVAGESPWWLLADSKVSRAEVLKAVRARRGDGGPLDRGVDGGPKLLEMMIREDAAHVAPEEPLEKLSAERRLAELIFRLRDETGVPWMANGGPPGVFSPPDSVIPPTISDRIAALGKAAVPALVRVLDDRRFTRAVGAPRGGAIRILRIGQVAVLILEKIAGRPFGMPGGAARVRAWWSAVEEKGEFMALADELAEGTSLGPYVAARLAVLDARPAAPLIVRAARDEKDLMRRKRYVDVLDGLRGPGVEPFLRREARSGPGLAQRVAAAFALRARGDRDAAALMRAAWRDLSKYGSTRRSGQEQWSLDGGIHQLVVFLVDETDPETFGALIEGLDRRPARVRGLVAQALGRHRPEYGLVGYLGRLRFPAPAASPPDEERITFLRSLLGDAAKVEMSYAPHIWRGEGPAARLLVLRVKDLAARAQASLDPKRFPFDLPTAIADRDRAILEIGKLR